MSDTNGIHHGSATLGDRPPDWLIAMCCDADRMPGHGNRHSQDISVSLGVQLRSVILCGTDRMNRPVAWWANPEEWRQ